MQGVPRLLTCTRVLLNPPLQIYGVHHQLWRKSSQWFGLMRKHAEVVMQDKNVYNA